MSASEPPNTPVDWDGIDPNVPNVARMYDYMLGGKDNFAADRDLVDQVLRESPWVQAAARHNRQFGGRAVEHVIRELALTQFIDIGSGLPTQDNVHQVAQRACPQACVVYVDIDTVVACHARALLATDEATIFVVGDVRQIDKLLHEPEIRELIAWDKPVVIVMVAVLHFVSDDHDPAAIIDTLWSMLPNGSAIIFTHACTDGVSADEVATLTQRYRQTNAPVYARSKQEILGLFGDKWTWLDPDRGFDDKLPDEPRRVSDGLVPVQFWRPHPDALIEETAGNFIGGVAVRYEPNTTAA
ncbi:SAM-dependent methyltransferase [Nonomuraea sp. KM90]|uniref:SAM-dependent methyltransferase n=1 Tax=Nonomuraea sp. KM90 TaxID=3457428 RepID=UPI003FCCD4A6